MARSPRSSHATEARVPDDVISDQPTEGPCYDPSDGRYWSQELLQGEIARTFEVCRGCRMCSRYCDSFPKLFRLLDERHDGDMRRLSAEEIGAVMGACFQCGLCEVQCSYTPREQHPLQLDVPKLVHRYRAIQARQRGLSIRDRLLGRPDRLARFSRASLGLARVLGRVGLLRWLMERVLGIHRSKQLPQLAQQTFERWAQDQGRIRLQPGGEVVVFATCYVNHSEPQIGRDTLEVLDHNEVQVSCSAGAGCCGVPAWEAGDLDGLQAMARTLLDRLSPHVEAGAKIAVLQPTCAMMLRREYPELIADPRARALAEAVVDPGEYLWSLHEDRRFDTAFRSSPPGGGIAYHAPCHLRAQAVGFRGRDLMRCIPGTKIKTVMECCGHGGTHAVRVEGFEPSVQVGQAAFDGMRAASAEIWASECALAGLQLEQHAGQRVLHPMSVLARAYRPDGFQDLIQQT